MCGHDFLAAALKTLDDVDKEGTNARILEGEVRKLKERLEQRQKDIKEALDQIKTRYPWTEPT